MRPETLRRGLAWNVGRAWAGIAVVVGVTWGAMSVRAWRDSERSVADRRALGMPVKSEEFPVLPAAENGWPEYEKAGAISGASGVTSPSGLSDPVQLNYRPLPAVWWRHAEASRAANGAVFAAIMKASEFPQAASEIDPATILGAPLRTLNEARRLANLTADEALRRHLTGDDAGAIELIEAIKGQAGALMRGRTLMEYLVGLGCDAVGRNVLFRMAPTMRIGPGPKQVSPEWVRAEIGRQLKVDPRASETWIAGEAVFAETMAGTVSPYAWLTGPYLKWATAQAGIRAAAAVRELRGGPALAEGPSGYATDFSMSTAQWGRLRETESTVRVSRSLVAVALAVALYRAEHGGAWPADEAALVPAYLPEMPLNLFGATGDRIEYRLAKLPAGWSGPWPRGVTKGWRPVMVVRNSAKAETPLFVGGPQDGKPEYEPNWTARSKDQFYMDLAWFDAGDRTGLDYNPMNQTETAFDRGFDSAVSWGLRTMRLLLGQ